MKKFMYLVLLFAAFLVLPFAVYAEDEDEDYEAPVEEVSEETTSSDSEADSKEVNVYFFRGQGCSHCAEAEEWFKSIEEEYGSYFKIVDYETWYNEDNAKLMQEVADARGEKAEGVPYIIIGDQSWNGFSESYTEDMINQIKSVYAQDVSERYDIMTYLPYIKDGKKVDDDKDSNDALALILIILVTGGIGFGVYQARKKTN